MSDKPIRCLHCNRQFQSENSRWQHSKVAQKGKKNPRPQMDGDESYADREIAAREAIAVGQHTDDAWLVAFPEDIKRLA